MIIQSLVRYYDQLLALGKMQRPGWQDVKASFALRIDAEGQLQGVIDLRERVQITEKKSRLVPMSFGLPAQVKRSSGISANFLCDNTAYLLGVDDKGKPERSIKNFEAAAALHHELLDGVDDTVAKAILRFFDTWKPQEARQHELLAQHLPDMLSGNLLFMVGLQYAHEVPAIRAAWQQKADEAAQDSAKGRCLATGEMDTIARLHPSIKGVMGAQPTGASLVSFNVPSFESYGYDGQQGVNASVGEHATFAYTTALNHLLAQPNHTVRLGNTTVVFWAEDAQEAYADMMSVMLGNSQQVSDELLDDVLTRLANGRDADWESIPLHPQNRFYLLGLAPNASRLAVRFFLQDTFGAFAKNLRAHIERMEIVKPSFDTRRSLSVWQLLDETVNPNANDRSASPQMAGDTLRAILTNGRYPATLYNLTEIRVRAEQDVNRGKAAIIKAYLLRNLQDSSGKEDMKEALTVMLNENTTHAPYVLGRLFAVLEGLQEAAIPGINTTIRDRYFSSACSTPARVFPTLLNLSQSHAKAISDGLRVYFEKEINAIIDKLEDPLPKQLDVYEQGSFQLGYYHQKQKRYEKKEDK